MEIFQEVYSALAIGASRLALMGARTIFDMIANAHVGDTGGFEKKLADLKSNEILSGKQVEFVKRALEAGNAAAHRGYKPSESSLTGVWTLLSTL